jgi:hypothetical protein
MRSILKNNSKNIKCYYLRRMFTNGSKFIEMKRNITPKDPKGNVGDKEYTFEEKNRNFKIEKEGQENSLGKQAQPFTTQGAGVGRELFDKVGGSNFENTKNMNVNIDRKLDTGYSSHDMFKFDLQRDEEDVVPDKKKSASKRSDIYNTFEQTKDDKNKK